MAKFLIAVIVSIFSLFALGRLSAATGVGQILLAEMDTENFTANFQSGQQCNVVQQLVYYTNAERARGANCNGRNYPPSRPVMLDPSMSRYAQLHADRLASQNTGGNPVIYHSGTSADIPGPANSENVWVGNVNPLSSVSDRKNGFLGSHDGHCENMMSGKWARIGFGVSRGRNGMNVVVQQFN